MGTAKNPIIEKLQSDETTGTLDFEGIRYLLVRPETFMEIQKVIEEKFGVEAAREIFYQSGFKGTSLTAKKLLDAGMSPGKCLEEMFKMGAYLGWGRFEIIERDENGSRVEITIKGSPFAGAYGVSEQPVCAILCGALAGIFSTLKGTLYTCSETMCCAAGDTHCHFILKQVTD
ncbi:MAG: hypothetical protein DSY91_06005 [Deltaproteobacteria bacterium]|nr:MAG: hypothetical protein DSY91_06005 [Deltaproteobacteria bacterium]